MSEVKERISGARPTCVCSQQERARRWLGMWVHRKQGDDACEARASMMGSAPREDVSENSRNENSKRDEAEFRLISFYFI